MDIGKAGAQLGHAFCDSLEDARRKDPNLVANYRNDEKGGSKVALRVRNQNQLLRAYNEAREAGLPCSIVVDREHVIEGTAFDGSPIITAVGIGPCTQEQARHITKRANCL